MAKVSCLKASKAHFELSMIFPAFVQILELHFSPRDLVKESFQGRLQGQNKVKTHRRPTI